MEWDAGSGWAGGPRAEGGRGEVGVGVGVGVDCGGAASKKGRGNLDRGIAWDPQI